MRSFTFPLLGTLTLALGCSATNPQSSSAEGSIDAVSEALTDATTWQQAGSTSQRAHVNGYEKTIGRTNASSLEQRWSAGATGPTSAAVIAGRVYTGAFDGTVRALDAETGATVWTTQVDGGAYYTPAVGYGRVFVTAGNALHVINASTGNVVYRVEHDTSVGYTAPLLADGKVIVRDAAGKLHAYDPKAAVPTSPIFTIDAQASAGPSFGRGFLYVPTSTGRVAAYSTSGCTATCTPAWETEIHGVSYFAPALWPPRLVLTVHGDDGAVYTKALDAMTGAILWESPLWGASDATAPAMGYGNAYVGLVGANELWAIRLTDGVMAWKAPLAADTSDTPAVANQVVYIPSGSTTGHLQGFSTSCTTTLGGTCTALVDLPIDPFGLSPSIANGRIYASGAGSTTAFGL